PELGDDLPVQPAQHAARRVGAVRVLAVDRRADRCPAGRARLRRPHRLPAGVRSGEGVELERGPSHAPPELTGTKLPQTPTVSAAASSPAATREECGQPKSLPSEPVSRLPEPPASGAPGTPGAPPIVKDFRWMLSLPGTPMMSSSVRLRPTQN